MPSSQPLKTARSTSSGRRCRGSRPTSASGGAAGEAERRRRAEGDGGCDGAVLHGCPVLGRSVDQVRRVQILRRGIARSRRGRAARSRLRRLLGARRRGGSDVRPARLRAPSVAARTVSPAEGGGQPVEDDREDRRPRGRPRSRAPTSIRLRLATTSPPSPPAPTMPAMTTIESESMMTWLTPAMMLGMREGQLDLAEDAPRRRAEGVAGLDDLRVDAADAELGEPDAGSHREDDGRDDAGDDADAEQDERRDQVDERRHRLHEVEHGPDDRRRPVRRAARMPSGMLSAIATAAATSTSASVSIAFSHWSSSTMKQEADRGAERRTSSPCATNARAAITTMTDPEREVREDVVDPLVDGREDGADDVEDAAEVGR